MALACLAALGIRALLEQASGRPVEARQPSLLLITIDTLRSDRVGVYGGPAGLTPALDALAARGVVFEEALASVPLTLPSHATILSGREPVTHGVHDNGTYVFPETPETLATVLRRAGYSTGAFVGAYVLDRRFGLARGFDRYDDRIERRSDGPGALESSRRCTEVVAAARPWLEAQKGPFFAWVHFYDPHAPYDAPSPFAERHPGKPYDAEVAATDACLGDLVAASRAVSREALLVAAISDHGEALGDHGELTHGFFVYQSTLRIPFLLAGTGVPAGERRPGLARTADVMPTLLARLGIPPPAGVDGIDLLAGPAPREAYAESLYPESFGWAGLHSFRLGPLKLIEAPRPELYDLAADPAEQSNLASARPQVVDRLRGALAAVRAREVKATPRSDDPEVAERLRALGYVASAAGARANSGDQLDPKDALPLYLAFEQAVWADARGERARALADLRALVGRNPANATFRRTLASLLRAEGDAREAARLTEDLEETAPDDAVAWHDRALALAAAGQPDEALRADERASLLNPLLPEPHNHRGVLLASRGRPGEALTAFDEALRLDPNNAQAWSNRGNALRALGRTREAEDSYRRAVRLAPNATDPLNGLGVLAVEAGRWDEAASLFARILAVDARYDEARLNLAVVEARRGHFEEAERQARQVAEGASDRDLAARARALLADLGRSR